MDENKEQNISVDPDVCISIMEDGPYIVTGGIPLKESIITKVNKHYVYEDGKRYETGENYTLCRCGKSKNPPFCDGAHVHSNFDGKETASRIPYADRAEIFFGQEIDLMDDNRCAFARFCHRDVGDVWTLTGESDDPHLKDEAIIASQECPAGRLQHVDKAGNVLEPNLEPEIEILQDPEKGVSAALFVKGGIPLQSADGTFYEQRNRYTLCRCGASRTKPFCDAMHVNIDFQD